MVFIRRLTEAAPQEGWVPHYPRRPVAVLLSLAFFFFTGFHYYGPANQTFVHPSNVETRRPTMASPEQYPEIPSPSGASFRTLRTDEVGSTPMRTASPAPARRVDERSRLLERSEEDDEYEYGTRQAERVERRRRSSSYAVVNTGSTSGVGSATIPRLNHDDAG